jgi:hypothetical protein
MVIFLAGFVESIGIFLNIFFVPIFLITLVLTAVPQGPDHVAHWRAVLLPASLAGGTWLVCTLCRLVRTRTLVNKALARYRAF